MSAPLPGRSRHAAAFVIVASFILGSGYAAWAAQPIEQRDNAADELRRPATASAQPPVGLLTELERKRHARFLQQAAAGNIDVVFLGDSDVDFWRYDNSGNPPWNNHSGGKADWDQSYVPLRAVNFGVEGAHTRSVLWRLQNGELDGMNPKVVVLSLLGVADAANHGIGVSQIIDGNKAIVAEIRTRQPQAKILLVAVPRGQPANLSRQVMKPVTDGLAKLADRRSIYYLDLNDRFLATDGTLRATLYVDGLGQVLSPQGYSAWAQAMNPTLVNLLR
jgi:lysophospholipase L1-like esterase